MVKMNLATFLPPLFGADLFRPLPAGGGALLASSLGRPQPSSSIALKRPFCPLALVALKPHLTLFVFKLLALFAIPSLSRLSRPWV